MAATLEKISFQAESLPRKARILLAERLLESADEISQSEWEKVWIAELKRRYKKFLAGKTKSRSAADVFRDIKKLHKK